MPKDRLIVALDYGEVYEAVSLISRLDTHVQFYKIGPQLILAGGLHLVEYLTAQGKRVFLDLKLHDIEKTVTETVALAVEMNVAFLTVHGYPKTMMAAIEGRSRRNETDLKLLAVTVLTSYDDEDCLHAGFIGGVVPMCALRTRQALDLGIDGLICSPHEVVQVREGIGRSMIVVTPGIRPEGSPPDDQKRTMTASEAITAGADYLVVGRPITEADDPVAAVEGLFGPLASTVDRPC